MGILASMDSYLRNYMIDRPAPVILLSDQERHYINKYLIRNDRPSISVDYIQRQYYRRHLRDSPPAGTRSV